MVSGASQPEQAEVPREAVPRGTLQHHTSFSPACPWIQAGAACPGEPGNRRKFPVHTLCTPKWTVHGSSSGHWFMVVEEQPGIPSPGWLQGSACALCEGSATLFSSPTARVCKDGTAQGVGKGCDHMAPMELRPSVS